MSYLIDAIYVALLLLFLFFGLRRGFLRSLFSLLGAVVAIAVALLLGHLIAPWLYDTFFQVPLRSAILNALVAHSANTTQQLLSILPGIAQGAIQLVGGESALTTAVTQAAPQAATTILSVVGPAIVTLCTLAIAFVLVWPLLFLVRLVLKPLHRLAKRLPLIKQVNALLGAALGLCKGIVLLWLFTMVATWLIPLLGDGYATALHQSYLYDWFIGINPLSIWFST